MNEERLLKIEEIYHDVLEVPAQERSSFLQEVCGDDAELLSEVESLLSFAGKDSSLIDTPPTDVAAEMLSFDEHTEFIGREIGHFKILSHIGTGGMGEVFLARDKRLERFAAIKFIKPEIARIPDQLRRFLREAKTASALNHPNIITVYEVGEIDNIHFIATEFIEGKTLRKVMSEASLTLDITLDIISQVLTAAQAAHSAGIIHRDIKPENIILREDGLVKVLDFGLAKLGDGEKRGNGDAGTWRRGDGEKEWNSSENSASPRRPISASQSFTLPGLMMGTVAYMSPEQARIETIDKRSDIWSIGVILYEMISGRKPFRGGSAKEKINSILEKEPEPISENVPFELGEIIEKALQKDVEKRYQTVEDLLQDINSFQENFVSNGEVLHTTSSSKKEYTTSPNEFRETTTGTISEKSNQQLEDTNSSNVGFVVETIKKRKTLSSGAFLTFVAALVLGIYSITGINSDKSIAVLPFTNESGDQDVEYISDGIGESVINSLSQLSGLKVIAENSSSQFKGKDVPVREIADKLGVKFILRGRVVRYGDDFQVYAELIKASDMTKIWGDKFDRNLGNVLNVESEISKKIADQMQIHLTKTEQQQLGKEKMVNQEAYKLLIKGNHFQSKGGLENSLKAVDYYERAIDLDPNYAKAYVDIANSYLYLGLNSFLDPKEAFPKAKTAANKALEINENLAQLHISLAGIKKTEWDWKGVDRAYKRALELNPNLGEDYLSYAFFLSTQGRHGEALSFIKKGRELDPLRFSKYADLGLIYYFGRQYNLADEQYKIGLELEPDHVGLLYAAASLNSARGNYAEALKYYQKAHKFLDNHTGIKCYYGFTLAKSGKLNEAKEMLKDLKTTKEYVSPVELAVLYIGLNEHDKAISTLEQAYSERDSQMQFLGVDPHFDEIRSDPRFIDLMKRVGLSPENYN